MASKTLLKIRTHATAIRKSETWQLLILPVLGAEHLNVRMLSLERFIQSLFYCGCLYFPNHKHSSALRSSKATLSDTQSAAQLIAFSPSGENATLTFIFFSSQKHRGTFQYVLSSWLSYCQVLSPPPHFISVLLAYISLQYFGLTSSGISSVLQANPLFPTYTIIIQFTAMSLCTYLNFNHQHGRACSRVVQELLVALCVCVSLMHHNPSRAVTSLQCHSTITESNLW